MNDHISFFHIDHDSFMKYKATLNLRFIFSAFLFFPVIHTIEKSDVNYIGDKKPMTKIVKNLCCSSKSSICSIEIKCVIVRPKFARKVTMWSE